MRPRSLLLLIACALLSTAPSARAQSLTGTYVLSTPRGDSLTLTFNKDSAGITRGRVTGHGTDIALTGRRRAGGLAGATASANGPGYFSAALRNGELDLVLADVNPNGSPRFDTARQFVLFPKPAHADSTQR